MTKQKEKWEKDLLPVIHVFANVVTDRYGEVASIRSSDFLTASSPVKSFIRHLLQEQRDEMVKEFSQQIENIAETSSSPLRDIRKHFYRLSN